MKILALSDKVEPSIYSTTLKDRFGDMDLVLSCGDLPFYYLEFIVSALNVPLCYVMGNHGPEVEYTSGGEMKTPPDGCLNVDGRVVEINGLLIGGLEGSMRYNHWGRFQYTEHEMWLKTWCLAPRLWLNRLRQGRYLDILITHAPPYGIHDGPDVCHTGFKAFLEFVDRYRPRYLLHGHRHHYSRGERMTVYSNTIVLNLYGHQVIESE